MAGFYSQQQEQGFTLIELLVAISIVGVLAALAIPNYTAFKDRARAAATASEIRSFAPAFFAYQATHEQFPPDNHEAIPDGMEDLLPPAFVEETPIGGRYNWEGPDQYGYAGISISGSPRADLIAVVDGLLDDGDTNSGSFQVTSNGRPTFLIEPE